MRDRIAVVTGGGGGIGSEVARELARRGATVVVVDPGTSVQGDPIGERTAEETVRRIEEDGGVAVASTVSVTDRAAVSGLFADTVRRFGSLDVVVNAAGIVRFPPLDRASDEDWSAVVDVHLGGYLNVLAAGLPIMAAAGYGRIVGVTSGVGLARTSAGGAAYGSAKRAVAGLTWQVGAVAPAGVTVNALSPIAATRMVREGLRASGADPAGLDLSAMPQPAEMAPMAAHLASEAFGWCSGQVLFSAGSEFSLMVPPRLLEAVGTDGGPRTAAVLDTVVPQVLVPAETGQRTTGGSNPRFGPLTGDLPQPSRGTRARCLVVGRDAEQAAALAAALAPWGHEVLTCEPDAASPIGALDAVVVLGSERLPPADEAEPWRRVLDSHSDLVERLAHHAAWQSAAVRSGVPRRLVHVVPATTPGGRTTAQAVVQLARSSNDTASVAVETFAIGVETDAVADRGPLADLVARLVAADDVGPLAGAELVCRRGWLGLRAHPAPGATVALAGTEPAGWIDDALRAALQP